MNHNKAYKPVQALKGWNLVLALAVALLLIASDIFAQTGYDLSLRQRRLGNQIGVEVWIKSQSESSPKLGNMSVAVVYNTSFLTPADPTTYSLNQTDSVDYDVNQNSPLPYRLINSSFHSGSNGYSALRSQAANISGIYVSQLDVSISLPTTEGFRPLTTGRGSFVGILKFDISNHATLTNSTLSNIQINTSTVVGDLSIFDVSGNDMEGQTTLVTAPNFTIRGLTLLNPNGPNEAVNRYKQYPSLPIMGYPIYFERSGLITPAIGNVYGSNVLAFAVDYSTNNGTSWSTEVMRFAETRLTAQELIDLGTDGNHVTGEITTSTGTTAGYYVTQGDGTQLPVETSPGYGGVIRIVWDADRFFAPRSEQALLRITQLSESGNTSAITSRKYAPGASDLRTGAPYDISDAAFVLSRLFFLQVNGGLYSSNTYLRTRDPFSNPHVLTVEAWINLNSYNTGENAEPAIVATGPGMAMPEQEGAWMLYLHQGKYPAFRALESSGTKGENGTKYIATVISPDSILTASDAFPINENVGHPENWYHIAATVNQNVVRLYVNGELVKETINNNAVDVRMPTYSHPVWVGLNPMGTITEDSYLHAGIKEVKVWRKALSQNDIRTGMSGTIDPATWIDPDNRSSLDLYYDFVGTYNDKATTAIQGGINPINFYTASGLMAPTNNTAMRFRPDRAHIRLTSPTGGEGISNLSGSVYEVRWAAYGLGDASTTSADLAIEFSRDGGTQWAIAHDNTGAPAGNPLDQVEIEGAAAYWEPYNNVNVVGSYLDLRAIVPAETEYTKTCLLRIRGTDANNQSDIVSTSGSFVVAPTFAFKNTTDVLVRVPGSTVMNMTGGAAFFEAWVRPYRFPTTEEGYYPILTKIDDATGAVHYALRLLSTGQIQFALIPSGQTTELVANSDINRPLMKPIVTEMDSAWTHIGVYVNLANGAGSSMVRFYIDGNVQSEDSLTQQLGANVSVDNLNTYPVYIASLPNYTPSFIGEIREIRFWNGVPAGVNFSGNEPNELTNFIRGALTVRADQLLATPVNYRQNLAAAFTFNGGSYVFTNYAYNSILSNSASSNLQAQVLRRGDMQYTGVQPYLKLVEPTYKQEVANTVTNLLVRWVGFNYDGHLFTTGDNVTNKQADVEYSTFAGGEIEINPYNPVASKWDNAIYTPNSLSLPSTSTYRFPGTNPPQKQFAGLLDVSMSDPDVNNDGVKDDRGPISATLANARLRLSGRAQVNSASPLEYTTLKYLRTEGPVFTITPASNFTIRVLLEGYHKGSADQIAGVLGTTYATNGLRINLYSNAGGRPGSLVKTAQSAQGYAQTDPLNPVRGTDGSEFADVPFVFTDMLDGDYYVVVEHNNHLPIMSKTPAPFYFSGDDKATWAIESGFDFIGWNGVANSSSYPAYGYAETSPANSDYGATGLHYNNGQDGSVSINQLAAMVAGDVVKDGKINAADRVKVRVDAAGVFSYASDVTGDGFVNGLDRQIVDRNNNKVSSLTELNLGMVSEGGELPGIIAIEDEYPNEVISELDPELSYWLNLAAREFVKGGKVNQTVIAKTNDALQAAGISYKVYAEAKYNGEYVDISVFMQNEGEPFAPGNCTFALTYDPSALQFEQLVQTDGSIWDNDFDKGYSKLVSAPNEKAVNPLPDVRTIEIDYDGYSMKSGNLVPYQKTLVGTIRFKVRAVKDEFAFAWHKSKVVLRTDGANLTGDGMFMPIKSVNTVKTAQITAPNGGELWKVGKVYTVSWTLPTKPATVFAELSIDNGATWERMTQQPVDIFAASLQVVAPKVNSTECLIRLVDSQTGVEIDRTDYVFSILPATAYIYYPASNDPIRQGGKKDIVRWSVDDVTAIYFEFSENGSSNWVKITPTVNAMSGQTEWTVPFVNTKTAVIQMINAVTGEFLCASEPFRVLTGTLAFTSPREGANLKANTDEAVRWVSENLNFFDLQFSADGGKTWILVEKAVQAPKGSFLWKVPNMDTDQGILRAVWNGDNDMEIARTKPFKVSGAPTDVEEMPTFAFSVEHPFPNPTNYEASVRFTLPQNVEVYATVFNAAGMKVAELMSGSMLSAGSHSVVFNGSNLPSGVYYISISAGVNNAIKEIILAK